MLPPFGIAIGLLFAHQSLAQTSLSLSAAPKATNAAVSSPLDASFAGFGIESSNLFSFTGNAQTNGFSVQLMQNLADYAGAPPHIRLGGNTQDYMVYESGYTDYGWKSNPQSISQGKIAADSIVMGPGFFKALDRFPRGTPVTYGLNLAYSASDWQDRIVAAAQAAVDGMQKVKLYSFEIGNEPDLYLQNQLRSGAWSGKEYTQEFLARADVVYNQVLKPAGMPSLFFEPAATASTIGTTFEIKQLVQDGLMKGLKGNNYVSVWNQHDYFYFIGVTPEPLTLNDLMDLDATNRQFAYWEQQVAIGLKTGIPYVLREMSSVGPIGMHLVSDTFGAALWTLNFFLYTAALNLASVQMHMTDNSNASAWQPRAMYGRNTFVRPQYYAHVAMNQVIGNGNGTTQVGSLPIGNVDSSYKGRLRAYSTYANSALQSIVLINAKQANDSTNAGSFTFTLNLGSANGNKDIFLSYLTADGADALDGVTFNGMSFAHDTGKMIMVTDTVTKFRTSSSGSVTIPVRDSQAVVANLGSQLGSNAVVNNPHASGGEKKSTAGPSGTAGASLAAWTGAVTTGLAFAGSVTGGAGAAHETGAGLKGIAVKQGSGVRWRTVGVCLGAVMVGFVVLG